MKVRDYDKVGILQKMVSNQCDNFNKKLESDFTGDID
jgi:hypothetical protein